MFPTKAGEFATAPRQESTVVPHPFRAARRAARARRRPQTGAERSRRFGLLFAKPLQAGNRQGGLTDKTRSLLNVRLYQIARDRRWRQQFTSPICRKSRPGKSAAGQSRHFGPASLTSGLARILLQKSFGGDERNFLGPLMRFARRDVRDHIAYQKNDHGASYRPRGALQR